MEKRNDFTQGSVTGNIIRLGLPLMLAQLINVLYNIVDRIYIGHLGDSLPLTGLGVCLPFITAVSAFANLFGGGGAPLCSIERGRGNDEEAERIMGTSFTLLLTAAAVLTAIGLVFKRPLLYLFGASDATYPYASAYITVYLLGSVFVVVGLGMNNFISAQGFGTTGMLTVLIGAAANILLDPLFIYVLHMGVTGAALASVLSQGLSCAWILRFLTGKKTILRLRPGVMGITRERAARITGLGLSGFTMSVTNSLVQMVCNRELLFWGGDLYVGVMTVLNSVREIVTLPVQGITHGARPVLGYNYGAGRPDRVKRGIVFLSVSCVAYSLLCWGVFRLIPAFFFRIFGAEDAVIEAGIPAMHIYFGGFYMMALQFAGQSVFVGLGKSRQAVFFSLLRKAVIVAPLTILLPRLFSLGTDGVFLAEPISNYVGGIACYVTMLLTVWRRELSEKKA